MRIYLNSLEEISSAQAITMLGFIPTFKKRLGTIYPGYEIKKVSIKNRPETADPIISLYFENTVERLVIEKNEGLYYECTMLYDEQLLSNPEERRKYLEGEYMFRDFPWGDLDLDLEVEFQ